MATKSQILRKNQILSALIEVRQNILTEVSRLSDARQNQVFLGIWSIRDLLAHLAGWDYTNKTAVNEIMAGRLPMFYTHHDHDWKTYNGMLVAEYARDSSEELIRLTKSAQRDLIKLLEMIPPEMFNKDFGVRFRGYKVTVQRLLEAEVKDEQIHLQQIVDFIKGVK
jgi:hypothetical protein